MSKLETYHYFSGWFKMIFIDETSNSIIVFKLTYVDNYFYDWPTFYF